MPDRPLISTQLATPPATSEAGSYESSFEEPDDIPLPLRTRIDVSDNDPDSPWSRKLILSLDGGGVKGYSSLLIIKRLMFMIAEIEQGIRPKRELQEGYTPIEDDYWEPNGSSGDYPWYKPADRKTSSIPKLDDLTEGVNGRAHGNVNIPSRKGSIHTNRERIQHEEITVSVDTCFDQKVADYKPHHYFDYMAGTSTGGLSAIMLGRMQMNIEQALEQYDTVGNNVFGKPRALHVYLKVADLLAPKYGPKQMETALQKVIQSGLAEEMKQHRDEDPYTPDKIPFESNPKKCRTMVVAHGPGRNKAYESSYIFRTYDHPYPSPLSERDDIKGHKNPGPAHTFAMWKVARATSAAPKYFSNIDIGDRTFRDGGMGANNPSSLALKEVRQMHSQTPALLLSVGTGRPPEEGGRTPNPGYIRDWGNVMGILQKLATQSEQTHLDVRDDCNNLSIVYYRQNVGPALKEIKLDEWKPSVGGSKTKERMLSLTKRHLIRPSEHVALVRCAEHLVRIRRERARGDRWESFAHDYVYVCPEPSCNGQNSHPFFARDDLRRHAIDQHEFVPLIPIRNGNRRYQYACVYDTCSQYGIHIFKDEEALKGHLKAIHKFREVRLRKPDEVERWLDDARMTQAKALERSATGSSKSGSTTDSPLTEKEQGLRDSLSGGFRDLANRRTPS
ncbi:MAG: hypothetical protein M1820_007521 [Bogoriella megaspora]|nr:MAG: hypothetical protein M1820_007521 [Bogoriella megaspora]